MAANANINLQSKIPGIVGANTNEIPVNQQVSGNTNQGTANKQGETVNMQGSSRSAGQTNPKTQGDAANAQGSETQVNSQPGNANMNTNNPLPMNVQAGQQNQPSTDTQNQAKGVNQGNVSPNEMKNPSVMVNAVPQVQQVKQEPQASPVMGELLPEPIEVESEGRGNLNGGEFKGKK